MKKLINLSLVAFVAFLMFQSFAKINLGKQRDGSDPGHTGSPGDNYQSCVKCHGGNAVNVNGWITSNVPAAGYKPGERYTIKATNTTIGHTRFGFQVSAQDIKGNLLGTLLVTDTIKTKLNGDGKYVTYRTGGVISQDSLTWIFDWIAPADTINEVTFYGAFNSNHDGHKGSDVTQLSQLKLYKEGFTAVAENAVIQQVMLYPNPAANQLNLSFQITEPGNAHIAIYTLQGKLVETLNNQFIAAGNNSLIADVSKYNNGIYFLGIKTNSAFVVKKFVISN